MKDYNRYKPFSDHVTKMSYMKCMKITNDIDKKLFDKFRGNGQMLPLQIIICIIIRLVKPEYT